VKFRDQSIRASCLFVKVPADVPIHTADALLHLAEEAPAQGGRTRGTKPNFQPVYRIRIRDEFFSDPGSREYLCFW
jgi:hypothetical protein